MKQTQLSRAAAIYLSRGHKPTDKKRGQTTILAAQRRHNSVAITRLFSFLIAFIFAPIALAQNEPANFHQPELHTFSIAAFDPTTGDVGVAVASKFLGVGSVVPYVKAGVGAVATQANANPNYGPDGLKLMESGKTAKEAMDELTSPDPRKTSRQIGIVDSKGNAAAYTGPDCGTWAGDFTGDHYTCHGNLLAGEQVVKKMGEAFEEARKVEGTELADWLLAALKAGDDVGGDKRGKQSAAVMVARAGAGYNGNDRYIDLRVEDGQEPIPELMRILEVHKTFFPGVHRRGRGGGRRGRGAAETRGGDQKSSTEKTDGRTGGENRGGDQK